MFGASNSTQTEIRPNSIFTDNLHMISDSNGRPADNQPLHENQSDEVGVTNKDSIDHDTKSGERQSLGGPVHAVSSPPKDVCFQCKNCTACTIMPVQFGQGNVPSQVSRVENPHAELYKVKSKMKSPSLVKTDIAQTLNFQEGKGKARRGRKSAPKKVTSRKSKSKVTKAKSRTKASKTKKKGSQNKRKKTKNSRKK